MAEITLLDRLDGLDARFEEVSTLITDPSVIADQKRYVRLSKEYHDLEVIIKAKMNINRNLTQSRNPRRSYPWKTTMK